MSSASTPSAWRPPSTPMTTTRTPSGPTEIGLPPDRLIRWGNIAVGDDHNFWQMADVGPCGPCSEIHFDRGAELSEGPDCLPDHSETCPRWLEIWNLVFMQFDRAADGTLTPLPFQSVDTGMGLERTASVLQGVDSNYRTDLFVPIIDRLAAHLGHRPEDVEAERFSYQVVADHSRAMTFLIGEGVHPVERGAGLRSATDHAPRRSARAADGHHRAGAGRDLRRGHRGHGRARTRTSSSGGTTSWPRSQAEEQRFSRTLQAGSERLAQQVEAARPERDDRAATTHSGCTTRSGSPSTSPSRSRPSRTWRSTATASRPAMAAQRERSRGAQQSAVPSDPELAGLTSEFIGYPNETGPMGSRSWPFVPQSTARRPRSSWPRPRSTRRAAGQIGDRGRLVGPTGR